MWSLRLGVNTPEHVVVNPVKKSGEDVDCCSCALSIGCSGIVVLVKLFPILIDLVPCDAVYLERCEVSWLNQRMGAYRFVNPPPFPRCACPVCRLSLSSRTWVIRILVVFITVHLLFLVFKVFLFIKIILRIVVRVGQRFKLQD